MKCRRPSTNGPPAPSARDGPGARRQAAGGGVPGEAERAARRRRCGEVGRREGAIGDYALGQLVPVTQRKAIAVPRAHARGAEPCAGLMHVHIPQETRTATRGRDCSCPEGARQSKIGASSLCAEQHPDPATTDSKRRGHAAAGRATAARRPRLRRVRPRGHAGIHAVNAAAQRTLQVAARGDALREFSAKCRPARKSAACRRNDASGQCGWSIELRAVSGETLCMS